MSPSKIPQNRLICLLINHYERIYSNPLRNSKIIGVIRLWMVVSHYRLLRTIGRLNQSWLPISIFTYRGGITRTGTNPQLIYTEK